MAEVWVSTLDARSLNREDNREWERNESEVKRRRQGSFEKKIHTRRAGMGESLEG